MPKHLKPFLSWKILLRWLFASALYYSYALRLYCWVWGRQRPVILTYHRVLNPAERQGFVQPGMYVRPQTFEKHLRYLTRCYQVVTMKQLMTWRKHPEKRRRPLCVITFDDGWSDNYHQALPLLRKYNCPATLFVATDFIGTGRTPWFYRLGDILHAFTIMPNCSRATLQEAEPHGLPVVLVQWLQASAAMQRQNLDKVIEALKKFQTDEIEQIIEQLQHLLQCARQSKRVNGEVMLNWQQVQEMNAYGVEIGSHTCSHTILTQIPQATLEIEVVESRCLIEAQLRHAVEGFCYPNGNHDEEVEGIVRATGYSYACATRSGYVVPHENPYRLKRIGVHDDITFSTALFACHIAGIFNRQ